jgi:CRISPR-associated protein Cas5d
MNTENLVTIRVWGDLACFTRPEMKVERVSYPTMTPSAARGILEAIFWEPQMYYWIHSITAIRHATNGRDYGKGQWVSFRRNEVTEVVNLKNAQQWMRSPEKFRPILAGPGEGRDFTQRNTLALANVAYLVSVEVRLTKLPRRPSDTIPKYRDELKRRATAGKCFHRPALGCREFAADFDYPADPDSIQRVSWEHEDLGLMLYDVFDPNQREAGFAWHYEDRDYGGLGYAQDESSQGRQRGHFGRPIEPKACFFKAVVNNARLLCHPKSPAVKIVKTMPADEIATD